MATKKAKTGEQQPLFEHHPLSEIFPMLESKELKLLSESIKAVGQKDPIWIADGKILDGRNRELAAKMAGVEPIYADIPEDADILEFLLACNVERRQLDASQRAIAAAKLERHPQGRPSKTQKETRVSDLWTLDELAAKFRVSQTAIKNGRIILDSYDESVSEAIESGHVTIRDASEPYVRKAPKFMQAAAVEIVKEPGPDVTLREAIRNLCTTQEMEDRRKEAEEKWNAAEAARQEEEYKQMLADEGITEEELEERREELEEAKRALLAETEDKAQQEFEALDISEPLPRLPFFDESGTPCDVDGIWMAAGSEGYFKNANRPIYITADETGLMFFRSEKNLRKFAGKKK